ncbi:cell division protein FtsZ [candidate division KSB1 bacterium]|nr:cell division protein FtsZ [candidate division KSB1 bacterium]
MLTIEKNSPRTPADKNKELEAVLRSHQTRIRVVGCGGGGNNTISRLMEIGVKGVETLAINTDAQDLLATNADDKILIGKNITKGLGAGSNPQIGEDSARENQQEIEEVLQNTDMVFVTCGLGGGTGTGSAPIVAEISKKLGALTIAVVTLPFAEEGVVRWENAKLGLEKLRQSTDTMIVIQNDRLLEVVPDLPLDMAFNTADETLVNAVKGITELITEKGLVNLDFADVRAIMQNGGTAMIGIGESEGMDGAQAAVALAMQNKLLDIDITGAKSALINVTGGAQMPLKDAKRVMQVVAEKLDASAKLIWGARIDPSLDKSIRVMLIVTGLPEKPRAATREERKALAEPPTAAPSPAKEQSPGGNGVEPNLGAIIQLAESLKPDVKSPNEGAVQLDAGQVAEKLFEPAEAKAKTPSVCVDTPAQTSGVDETPAPKRKRKAKSPKSMASAPAVEAAPRAAETAHPMEASAAADEVAHAVDENSAALLESEFQAPSASESEVAGKINAGAPPQAKPQAPLPNVDQAARPLIANRGVPQGARPQVPPVNRSRFGREVNALRGVAPNKPKPRMPGREEIRRVASANPGAPQPVRPKAPIVNRQEVRRASNSQPLPPPRPPVQNAPPSNHARPSEGRPLQGRPLESRPQAVANKMAPAASSTSYSHKLFEEKSLANLQTIRESIGHLFIDPARQETLRCMKSAAAAISNLAQRFVFNEIADYAATLEEICTRVLDGEINMNKKILNAFTEMPGIFEGMIQGDADAKAEAKRHQERLKRLADSFGEGEIFQATANTREAPKNSRPPMGENSFSRPTGATPGQKPAATPINKAAQQNVYPKPATEVMEYLDGLFSESKSSSSR